MIAVRHRYKPRATIDVDDTLVEFVRPFFIHARALGQGSGASPRTWSLQEELGLDDATAVDELVNLYLAEGPLQPPVRDAVEVVGGLALHYDLWALTARKSELHDRTALLLGRYFGDIFTDRLVCTDEYGPNPRTKGEVCAELDAVCHIDDGVHNLWSVASHGVAPVLFGSHPWNDGVELPAGTIVAQTMRDLEALIVPGGLPLFTVAA